MGDLLGGVGPHIVVSVGGTQVGAAFVNETAYASNTFTFDAAAGVQQVRVTFDNDDASSTEDRNLLLDRIEVQEPPPSAPPPWSRSSAQTQSTNPNPPREPEPHPQQTPQSLPDPKPLPPPSPEPPEQSKPAPAAPPEPPPPSAH